MTAAGAYAARIDAVAAQQERLGIARPDGWSRAAPRFRADPRRPLDETLTAIAGYLQPDDVFVDVGGGAGRIGLAMALRCREVVSVEPAPGMRAEFEASKAEAGIQNARCVPADWLAAEGVAGDLVLTFDVTYFVREIREFVTKLDTAARRRVLILIGSVPPPNMNATLFRLVRGEEQEPVPGQRELLPVLWELGLVPEVRVLSQSPLTPAQPHVDRTAAIEAIVTTGPFAGDAQVSRTLETHFDELFTPTPQGYLPAWRPESKTLIITWETRHNAE